jgi:ABC-type lipoprotein export system ATPase subunit
MGKVPALYGVDLTGDDGEMVAIMGPSGSRKTKLMNILGCLDISTRGRYLLAGTDVSRLSDHRLGKIRSHKIGFARTLINDPAILLADEPTGNLDTTFSIEIMKLLGALNDAGRTIVITTHEEIARFTKRVLRMREGYIQSDQRKRARTEVSGISLMDGGLPQAKVSP